MKPLLKVRALTLEVQLSSRVQGCQAGEGIL